MSLISDVLDEIGGLDTSEKGLRKFGYTVGLVFILITAFLAYKNYVQNVQYLLGSIAIFLIVFAFLYPMMLKKIYRVWMTIAFTMGWFVSRVLLGVLFYTVITPIGIIARISGKEFLNLKMKKDKQSYWIRRDPEKEIYYGKMY